MVNDNLKLTTEKLRPKKLIAFLPLHLSLQIV